MNIYTSCTPKVNDAKTTLSVDRMGGGRWGCTCCKNVVNTNAIDAAAANQCSSPFWGGLDSAAAAQAGGDGGDGGCTLKIPDVGSSEDSGEVQLWSTTPTLAPTTDVVLSCAWNDQGWGNRKGTLWVRLAGAAAWVQLTREAAPHDETPIELKIPSRVFTVDEYSLPLNLELGYTVGGGGGHAMNVKRAKLEIKFDLCCICALDFGYYCNMCEGCCRSWTNLKTFEITFENGGGTRNPDEFLKEVNSSRELVGASLQYRLDLTVVNTLLQSEAGADALVALVRDGAFQFGSKRGSETLSILAGEDGKLDLSVSVAAHQAARREKDKTTPVKPRGAQFRLICVCDQSQKRRRSSRWCQTESS